MAENNIQSFIIKTMQTRIDDPNNSRFWLPSLLENLKDDSGNPVFPLKKEDATSITLQGAEGSYIATTLAGDWVIAEKFPDSNNAIPDPDSCLPQITLKNLTLSGLTNVYLQPGSISSPNIDKTGYITQATLQFNYYPEPQQPLEIVGSYDLTQKACTAATGATVCDKKYYATIEGIGDFTAQVTNCCIDVNIQINIVGQGDNRSLNLSILSMIVRGETLGSSPDISYSNLTLTNTSLPSSSQDAILNMARTALESDQGIKAMIQAINETLAQPSTTENLGTFLTQNTNDLIDNVFAPLPVSGLPADGTTQEAATSLDLYLFDRMRAGMNNPESKWYLPFQMASSENPILEPYTTNDLSIPDQTIDGLEYSNIKLTNVTIAGASNLIEVEAQTVLNTPNITLVLLLGTLPQGPLETFQRDNKSITMNVPPAPPVILFSDFTFTQQGFSPLTITGKAVVCITGIVLNSTVIPSGADLSTMTLSIEKLDIDFSEANMSAQIIITPPNATFSQIAEHLLTSDTAKSQLSDAINQQFQSQLQQLSNNFSNTLRNMIAQQLDNNTIS